MQQTAFAFLSALICLVIIIERFWFCCSFFVYSGTAVIHRFSNLNGDIKHVDHLYLITLGTNCSFRQEVIPGFSLSVYNHTVKGLVIVLKIVFLHFDAHKTARFCKRIFSRQRADS